MWLHWEESKGFRDYPVIRSELRVSIEGKGHAHLSSPGQAVASVFLIRWRDEL